MDEIVYSLQEVSSLLGIEYEKLKTDVRRGKVPSVDIPYGQQRTRKGISASIIAEIKAGATDEAYFKIRELMLTEMRTGVWNAKGRAITDGWVDTISRYLDRYWQILGVKPSILGVSPQNLKTVMASFVVDRDAKRDHYSTRAHIYTAVTDLSKVLVREGYKPKSFLLEMKEFRPGRVFKPKRQFLDIEDVERARDINRAWLKGRTAYDAAVFDALLCLYAYGGLRKMEAANLQFSQVILDKGYIHAYGKWAIERIIPLVPALRQGLEDFIKAREKAGIHSKHFVPQADGSMLSSTSITTRFQRFKAHAKEEPHMDLLMPHALRRTCATAASIYGMPGAIAQRMLGHKHASTTEGYKQIQDRHMIDFAQTFEFRPAQVVEVVAEEKPEPERRIEDKRIRFF